MKNLATLRKAYGLSQQKFGDAVGLARNTICQYESGNRVPDVDTLIKLADYFGVTIDYLLGREYAVSSYQIFVEICAKEQKSVFEVAKEFELTDEQLIQWKNGIEPSQRTLWAIANAYHYYSENPFNKAREKKLVIERSTSTSPAASAPAVFGKMPDLLSEERFVNTAKIYHELPDELRERAYMLIYGMALGIGLNVEKIIGR